MENDAILDLHNRVSTAVNIEVQIHLISPTLI
jgi:hypothetical protein